MRRISIGVVAVMACLFNFQALSSTISGCKEGNCLDGYGKYIYANGNKYVGEFKSGKPHGNGIIYFANGNKYLGNWENSARHGEGKFIFIKGHEYTGAFKKNHFDGQGKMIFANGDIYEGNWKSNQPNGFGMYFFKKGGRYEGDFNDGRFHGHGVMYYKNGAIYNGQWRLSKKHGSGSFTDESGLVQHGKWANGEALDLEVVNTNEEEVALVVESPEESEKSPIESLEVAIDESAKVKVWATIVGVASYAHMPSLKYTDDDAYHFYAFLKSPEGGALPDEQIRVLVDDNATKENIITSMQQTLLKADENDVVLFYFSGHGVEGAFIPVDFDGFDNRLYHNEIRQVLDKSKAKHKIVLGDACHAGSLYGEYGEPEVVAARSTVGEMLDQYYHAFENSNGGLALLMSSKGQEVSLEDSGLRSGVFSHFLIKGLKGEADYDHNNLVTIDEIFQFTSDHVKGYTVGAQNPVLMGDFDRQMPVSTVRR